jgi:hypothetical protein
VLFDEKKLPWAAIHRQTGLDSEHASIMEIEKLCQAITGGAENVIIEE